MIRRHIPLSAIPQETAPPLDLSVVELEESPDILETIPLAELLSISLDEPLQRLDHNLSTAPHHEGARADTPHYPPSSDLFSTSSTPVEVPPTEVMTPLNALALTDLASRESAQSALDDSGIPRGDTGAQRGDFTSSETSPPSKNKALSQALSSVGWGSSALVITILVTYLLSVSSAWEGLSIQQALEWGANFPPEVVGGAHEWSRLITAPFLHWDLIHLSSNLTVLFLLGNQVERLLGMVGFLSLFICSAALAGLGTLVWYPSQVSLGASGGIYGLMGVLLMLSIFTQGARLSNALRQSIVIGAWLVIAFGINLNSPWVDNASHLGGIISGFILGFFFAPLYGVRVMSELQAWVWRAGGICFTTLSVMLALHLAPEPPPVFKVLKEYQEHTAPLQSDLESLSVLSPLERRAWLETTTKPRVDDLERRLKLIGDDLSQVRPAELMGISNTIMWSLWRLVTYWRYQIRQELLKPATSPPLPLPPRVALRLYDSLISMTQTSQVLTLGWDERICALERLQLWGDLPNAREYLSMISAALVSEASSVEVRERGSLWGDMQVREWRLRVIEDALLSQSTLSLRDQLTLAQIEWIRGDLDRVTQRIGTILRLPSSLQDSSDLQREETRVKLAKLWWRALIARLAMPSRPISVRLTATGQLNVTGVGASGGELYVSAYPCESRDEEGVSQALDPAWLFEISIPQRIESLDSGDEALKVPNAEVTPEEVMTLEYNGPSQQRPQCLERPRVIGLLPADERTKRQRSGWSAYPTDLSQRSKPLSK